MAVLHRRESLLRLGYATAGAVLWAATYYGAAHIVRKAVLRSITPVDGMIPCVPCFAWSYLAGMMLPFIPVWFAPTKFLNQILSAYVLLILLASATFVILPTDGQILRLQCPATANSFLRFIQQADPATNLFPSLHVAFAMMAALCMYRLHTKWSIMFIAAGIEAVTVCLVKQHSFVDSLGGAILAAICYLAVFRNYSWFVTPTATQFWRTRK